MIDLFNQALAFAWYHVRDLIPSRECFVIIQIVVSGLVSLLLLESRFCS